MHKLTLIFSILSYRFIAESHEIPTEKPFLIMESDSSIYLRWKAVEIPNYLSTNQSIDHSTYSIEASIDNGKHWKEYISKLWHTTFTLKYLDVTKHYQFRIRTDPKFGPSILTCPVDIQTESGIIHISQFSSNACSYFVRLISIYIMYQYLQTDNRYLPSHFLHHLVRIDYYRRLLTLISK